MPIVTTAFTPVSTTGATTGSTPPSPSTQPPVAVTNQLHTELAAIGLPVIGAELGVAPQFGAATSAQLKSFQARYGLQVTGELDPKTAAILSVAALVATEGDRSKLQAGLKAALNQVPDSPEYNYWLARYAIMAGDYATPATIMSLHPDLGGLLTDLGEIFDPGPQPLAPEVPYPENFYSYREDLIDQGRLDQLRSDLEALALKPQDYQSYIVSRGSIQGFQFTVDGVTFGLAIAKARAALGALNAWQVGNHYAVNRELSLAIHSYEECQSAVADYCQINNQGLGGDSPLTRIQSFLAQRQSGDSYSAFWEVLHWRRILISLVELRQEDREKTIGADDAFTSPAAFLTTFTYTPADNFDPTSVFAHVGINQMTRLDRLMVVLATVWVPLAIGEMNCQLRQFDTAIQGFTDLLISLTGGDVQYRYLCEFIEIPFIRLLTLQALIDKADAQYKTGATDVDVNTFPDTATYHGLLAAQTYEDILSHIGDDSLDYIANMTAGRDALVTSIQQSLVHKDTTSLAFRTLGKTITVPTISPVTSALPGLDRTLGPHQSIVKIELSGGMVSRATNPRLYAIGLLATAKLEQIKAGFNYLGYPADYVPPWRFSFLLDRARYFGEHAKNAERDYLNFLNNAEHEEFQEQSMAQNVEMENSDIRIETARVDQAQAEIAASAASVDLAVQTSTDAEARFDNYLEFDEQMAELDMESFVLGGIQTVATGFASGGATGGAASALGLMQGAIKDQESQAQRDLERENLYSTMIEANLAVGVANKRLAVDQAGLVVAGLQRQAAILRQEFSVQNLNYLRNRTLNAEQWFRLANAIRSVSDTYLHYAIELAFLAQQAYEFESGRLIEVIRFDYDLSEVGAMLAADFLLRDLDTLEQDLVVSQQTRLQQVRYVLSLAREFPETLRALADAGEVTFSMRLQELERHFPGLVNMRISNVDLLPVALMDPTRVSVELTHLGTGMVRLKSQPGNSPLNSTDLAPDSDWLQNAAADWPVRIHVSGPETELFSGLSRQDAASASMITTNERAAFEGLPGASSWRIDMSMAENQVVPGTLADVLITFVLSGYYDSDLNTAVINAASLRRPFATTSFISAQRMLPDSYYSLVHYGKLDWTVSERMLTLTGTPNELRNLAVVLPLVPDGLELGRCYCRYPVQIDVSSGAVNVLTALPQFALTPNGLTLNCAYTGPADMNVTWDFGDSTPLVQGIAAQHAYTRPGRYDVLAQLAKDGKLVEYRSAVVVSATHAVVAPLIVAPTFSAGAVSAEGTVALNVSLPPDVTGVSIDCSAGKVRGFADTGPATLNLKPGSYVLDFLATRNLSARFYSRQRYLPTVPLSLSRERISTNRKFDPSTGANTTTSPNGFTTQLFPSDNVAISPVDRWTLELPLAENPWFTTVSPADVADFDGSELADAILSLEFVSSV